MSAVFASEHTVSPIRAFREHAAAANRGATFSDSPAVWDPERDEMPSPFLVRRKPIVGFGGLAFGKGERGSA